MDLMGGDFAKQKFAQQIFCDRLGLKGRKVSFSGSFCYYLPILSPYSSLVLRSISWNH